MYIRFSSGSLRFSIEKARRPMTDAKKKSRIDQDAANVAAWASLIFLLRIFPTFDLGSS